MTEQITWRMYLDAISEGATGKRIAELSGVAESTVSRWVNGKGHPRPREVVSIAKAFKVHPLPALIAAGYLDAADVDLAAITPRALQLREFSSLELAKEIVRRIEEGESGVLDEPLVWEVDSESVSIPGSAGLRAVPMWGSFVGGAGEDTDVDQIFKDAEAGRTPKAAGSDETTPDESRD